MTAIMETPIRENEQKALSVPEQAKAFIVSDNDQHTKGEEFLATCKALEDEIHAAWDKTVAKAHAAHKEAVASRQKYLDPLEEGRRILKGKMIAFQTEQERKRQEAQRQAEVEARKREEEARLAIALEAEKSGDTATAEAIISEPIQAPAVIVPKTAPAPSRLSAGRVIWYAEVTDLKALCKAVADGKVPVSLIEANMPALNKMAVALKSSLNIPGVQARSRTV